MDTWSYFEVVGYVKDLIHKEKVKLWWKSKYGSFEKGLKEFKNDVDVVEMANYAVGNKYEVQLYVEIGSIVNVDSGTNNVVMNVVENEGGTTTDPGGELSMADMSQVVAEDIDMVEDDYRSDDSTKDVHFDYNKEERVLENDDGFELNDVREAEVALNQQSEQTNNDVGPSQQNGVDDSGASQIVPVTETFVPPNVSAMHENEEDYTSEELDSGASDIDDTRRPKYLKYRK
ncbi:hypothetical protein SESBI_38021 [Sesbania bispinosa]|nr:hypothetical protein SESBI_38021 [Sesbania bispinosa]